ncbi:hypothetical protein SEA_MAKAI_76 [Arthrobacter phage Makai]|nr:hypothetical protein SEA_MAKAI_76 [Arthrobacter phage Makai]QPX62538.1 hypothetical protein SEA_TRUCKEE_74 [Arthrobacter phage Truckee]
MVNNVQKSELADVIQSSPAFRGTRYAADLIAQRIIEAGWQPPKVELTEEQEVEILDRIVHGLPIPEAYLVPANPEGNAVYKKQRMELPPITDEPDAFANIRGKKLYDVASLHPQEVQVWKRLPDFDNYEINQLGEIRNRFTKRVLDEQDEDGNAYVEMHDKEGFPHIVSVQYQIEKAFGGN